MRISVVIPAYNAEPYLEACLKSVLAQTHAVEEILVVDDGSTDGTSAIAQSFGPVVRLLQQRNGGPARARNLAVAEATGEWVAFLDADDMWQPCKLEKQLQAFASAPDATLCYTGLLALKLDGTTVPVPPPSPLSLDSILTLTNPGIPPSAVMLRRATLLQIDGFSEVQRGCEDWELWFRLRRLGRFVVVQEPETVYRESLGGLSSNAQHMYQDFLQMLDTTLLQDKHGMERSVWRRRILSYQQYKAAMTARHAGQADVERSFVFQSLKTWPSPLWHSERYAAALVTLLRTLGFK